MPYTSYADAFFFVITELVEMEFVGTAFARMRVTAAAVMVTVALPQNTAMANKLQVHQLIQLPQCLHLQLMPANVEREVVRWVMASVVEIPSAAPSGDIAAKANNTAIRRGQTMEMTPQTLKVHVVEVALEMASARMNPIVAVSMVSAAKDQNIVQDTSPLMTQLTKT